MRRRFFCLSPPPRPRTTPRPPTQHVHACIKCACTAPTRTSLFPVYAPAQVDVHNLPKLGKDGQDIALRQARVQAAHEDVGGMAEGGVPGGGPGDAGLDLALRGAGGGLDLGQAHACWVVWRGRAHLRRPLPPSFPVFPLHSCSHQNARPPLPSPPCAHPPPSTHTLSLSLSRSFRTHQSLNTSPRSCAGGPRNRRPGRRPRRH